MDEREALERMAAARVGHLATVTAEGLPHVVPFVFVLDGRTVYWAVDAKPKRSAQLKRLQNIQGNPNVEIVVDHYDEDWSALWWVRARGTARPVEERGERARALRLLAAKYEQYAAAEPPGPVVAIELTRIAGWHA